MPVTISNYRDLFANVRRRPGMFLPRPDFASVAAYVEGCNQANAHALLTGFREWLTTQVGCGENVVWWGLVLRLTPPIGVKNLAGLDAELDARAVAMLFDLLDEFLELRSERDGLQAIYAGFE